MSFSGASLDEKALSIRQFPIQEVSSSNGIVESQDRVLFTAGSDLTLSPARGREILPSGQLAWTTFDSNYLQVGAVCPRAGCNQPRGGVFMTPRAEVAVPTTHELIAGLLARQLDLVKHDRSLAAWQNWQKDRKRQWTWVRLELSALAIRAATSERDPIFQNRFSAPRHPGRDSVPAYNSQSPVPSHAR